MNPHALLDHWEALGAAAAASGGGSPEFTPARIEEACRLFYATWWKGHGAKASPRLRERETDPLPAEAVKIAEDIAAAATAPAKPKRQRKEKAAEVAQPF